MRLLKVKEWFMMTCIVVFEKEAEGILETDRTVYSTAPPPQVCEGFTKSGKPCQNKTKCGEFCHLHKVSQWQASGRQASGGPVVGQ